jgi:uroporphyrinogen III methyltransferase/synthase
MGPKVYLIGAGPGDPGLITVKGLACIKKADVIIYDYLASTKLLESASSNAEILYVGKKGGDHTLSQEGINQLIVEKALSGLTVARLKGGDPFIFGRGAEEAQVLIAHNIPFEVVPGVTSAIAAPAYAGIPLTHRDHTATVAFITGHEDPTKPKSYINWTALATGIGTLVFLMGVKNLPNIVQRLIAHGMPSHTKAALVRWGTTAKQVVVSGTLDTIVERVKAAGLKAPAVIVVGEVVQLRETLNWFETRPLSGKTIAVTRAREQASDLIDRLSDLGAHCLACPTIKIAPPPNWRGVDTIIKNIDTYDWMVFTSVNGVSFFLDRLLKKGRDARALGNLRIAAIGPATAKRLAAYGLCCDIVPESFRAESIVAAFGREPIKGSKIALPRAAQARPILPVELRKMGAHVDEAVAYITLAVDDHPTGLIGLLENKKIDMVTFTSSSTAKNFHALLPPDRIQTLMENVAVASIGPITSDTAQNLGFNVTITAEQYTIDGLSNAIHRYFNPS